MRIMTFQKKQLRLYMKEAFYIILVIAALYLAFYYIKNHHHSTTLNTNPNDSSHSNPNDPSPTQPKLSNNLLFVEFVQKNFQQRDQEIAGYVANKQPVLVCDKLLNGIPFNFSQTYFRKMAKFNDNYQEQAAKHGAPEGFSSQVSSEALSLHLLASIDWVKTICETGFNYGHSSFNFLTAKNTNMVYSFDLGSHGYSRPMAEYLSKTFPGRHRITFGDSTKTVPIFTETELNRNRTEKENTGNRIGGGDNREKENFHCDLIFVDGGHVYNVAKADLRNLAKLGIPGKSLVVFDDYPTDWGASFGKAWEEEVGPVDNRIRELLRCTASPEGGSMGLQRGFVIGLLMKN